VGQSVLCDLKICLNKNKINKIKILYNLTNITPITAQCLQRGFGKDCSLAIFRSLMKLIRNFLLSD